MKTSDNATREQIPDTSHLCPICGKTKFPSIYSFEICEECGWEDDDYQEKHPEEDLPPNYLSMNEYKKKYEEGWTPEWLSPEE